MQTSKWGSPLWSSMFYVAAGYDLNKSPRYEKDPNYKTFYESLGKTIPCIFCRQSYEKFFQTLNIDRYLALPSCGLIRFVYDLKNLVNTKLENQETKALHEEYQKLLQSKSPDDPEFWKIMRDKGHKICYTKPAPPFEQVVADLMKDRAGCSAKMQSCRMPLNNSMYPELPNLSNLHLEREGPRDAEVYAAGGRGRLIRGGLKRKSSRRPILKSRKRTVRKK